MKTYPICLINMSQKRVAVVGGGKVAFRKVQGLLNTGAPITVISPKSCRELEELSGAGLLKLEQRNYRSGDLRGVFLVVAASDDPLVNQAVWEEGQLEGCLVNVVDDPLHSDFILPAVVRRGEFTIGISTGGASPALARRLREKMEMEYGPEYSDLTALLGELRPILMDEFPPGTARLNAALSLIDSDLINVLRQDGYSHAKQYALDIIMPDENYE